MREKEISMRFPTIFKRTGPVHEREEPTGARRSVTAEPVDGMPEDIFCGDTATRSSASENVFSLLDGRASLKGLSSPEASSQESSSMSGARVDPDALIVALHAHYCEALESSDGLSIGLGDRVSASGTNNDQPAALLAPEFESSRSAGTISDLFSGPQRLEEAIGPLSSDPMLADLIFDGVDLSIESAPEILQLFAPPEYHANAALRRGAVPPTLARREHHTLAIDSPLPEFHSAASSTRIEAREEATTQ